MKNFIISFLFIFSLAITGTSCNNDDDNVMPVIVQTKNIVELAQANGFTSLAAALTRADLISALEADGSFTVFAPTNAAFDALLSAIGQTSIDDVPVDVLKNILLYHVLDSSVILYLNS